MKGWLWGLGPWLLVYYIEILVLGCFEALGGFLWFRSVFFGCRLRIVDMFFRDFLLVTVFIDWRLLYFGGKLLNRDLIWLELGFVIYFCIGLPIVVDNLWFFLLRSVVEFLGNQRSFSLLMSVFDTNIIFFPKIFLNIFIAYSAELRHFYSDLRSLKAGAVIDFIKCRQILIVFFIFDLVWLLGKREVILVLASKVIPKDVLVFFFLMSRED